MNESTTSSSSLTDSFNTTNMKSRRKLLENERMASYKLIDLFCELQKQCLSCLVIIQSHTLDFVTKVIIIFWLLINYKLLSQSNCYTSDGAPLLAPQVQQKTHE